MNIKRNTTQWVQDTCLALKPIIGGQAEQLWQAYLVQDEDGKRELEEQIELWATTTLNADVENRTPVFLPPLDEEAVGDFPVGQVVYNHTPRSQFALRSDEIYQHLSIFGRSGAGKSNLAFGLLQGLAKAGMPLTILDWKRGWRELLHLPGFDDLRVYTVGRTVTPFRFNPLIPPPGVAPQA